MLDQQAKNAQARLLSKSGQRSERGTLYDISILLDMSIDASGSVAGVKAMCSIDKVVWRHAISGLLLATCPTVALAQDIAIDISGETRLRLEGVDGQFRKGRKGDDHLLLWRTFLRAKADFGEVAIVGEMQDSRTYLADDQTPLSASLANPVDILQLYADFDLAQALGQQSTTHLRLGRQTIAIGSSRQIERPSFANVVRSYSGAYLKSDSARGDEFHALLVVPVERLPTERELVERNAPRLDKEEWNRIIWGVHYRRADILPETFAGLWGEVFSYGLHETDTQSSQTPNRQYATTGGRLYRARAQGRVDLDIEAAWRVGTRRASSSQLDTEDLAVNAGMLFAKMGYTFAGRWQPNLALQYYYVSGDQRPDDGRYGQFERLFGSRRTDLGNTSIFGPLTPANLNAPGMRLEVTPSKRTDARITYSAAFLASDTDSWVIARLRDPTGRSGSFIGHAIDSRLRWRPKGTPLELVIGSSVLLYGGFAKAVPDGPEGNGSLFGFTQVTAQF